jgi:hypothetical protein
MAACEFTTMHFSFTQQIHVAYGAGQSTRTPTA